MARRKTPAQRRAEQIRDLRGFGGTGYLFMTFFGLAMIVMGAFVVREIIPGLFSLCENRTDPTTALEGSDFGIGIYVLFMTIAGFMIIGGTALLMKCGPIGLKILIGKEDLESLIPADSRTEEMIEKPAIKHNVRIAASDNSYKIYPLIIFVFVFVTHGFAIMGIKEIINGPTELGFMLVWTGLAILFCFVVWSKIPMVVASWLIATKTQFRVSQQPYYAGDKLKFRLKQFTDIAYSSLTGNLVVTCRKYSQRSFPQTADPDLPPTKTQGLGEEEIEHAVIPLTLKKKKDRNGVTEYLATADLPDRFPSSGMHNEDDWEWAIRLEWKEVIVNHRWRLNIWQQLFPITVLNPNFTVSPEIFIPSEKPVEQPVALKPPVPARSYAFEFCFMVSMFAITVGCLFGCFAGGVGLLSPKVPFLTSLLGGASMGGMLGGWIGFVMMCVNRRDRKTRDDILVGLFASLGFMFAVTCIHGLFTTRFAEGWASLIPSTPWILGASFGGFVFGMMGKQNRRSLNEESKDNLSA